MPSSFLATSLQHFCTYLVLPLCLPRFQLHEGVFYLFYCNRVCGNDNVLLTFRDVWSLQWYQPVEDCFEVLLPPVDFLSLTLGCPAIGSSDRSILACSIVPSYFLVVLYRVFMSLFLAAVSASVARVSI